MSPTRRPATPFGPETVWNSGLSGTGTVGDNKSLSVGYDGGWAPEHLLLLAVESCFMSTLLQLASIAGVNVLGYVSNGRLDLPEDERQRPTVSLSPCVVVDSMVEESQLVELARQAEHDSPIARLIGDPLHVTLGIRRVPLAAGG